MTDPLKPDTQYQILFDSNPQPMWVYETRTLRFLAVTLESEIAKGTTVRLALPVANGALVARSAVSL